MSESQDEEKEKATVLSHIADVLYPEKKLAPWASIHKRRTIVALTQLYSIADIATELDRRIWLDQHPEAVYHPEDEPRVKLAMLTKWAQETPAASVSPEKMQSVIKEMSDLTAQISEEMEDEDEEEDEGPEFDHTRVRGANGMFGYCMRTIADHTHNLAPSEGGMARKQGIGWGGAMRSGISIEPKGQSLWDKIRGKNKPQDQIASGTT